MKIIAEKPLGESKLGRAFGTNWNNLHRGDDGPVTCEICGKIHPEDEDANYVISRFLGRDVVEDCCGAILDEVYKESAEEFTLAFLEEFAENPTNPRFYCLLATLKMILPKARKKLAEVQGQVEEALTHLDAVKQ